MLDNEFTALIFTDKWLKDNDYGLFGIPMYAKVEKHAFSVTPAKYISKIDKYPFEHMGDRATGVIYLNPITHEEIKQILFSIKIPPLDGMILALA